MFVKIKVNNKKTRTTSMTRFLLLTLNIFRRPFYKVSIHFDKVNVSWVANLQ